MNITQQLMPAGANRNLTPYDTWRYFFKDMTNIDKKKTANLAFVAGALFLLTGLIQSQTNLDLLQSLYGCSMGLVSLAALISGIVVSKRKGRPLNILLLFGGGVLLLPVAFSQKLGIFFLIIGLSLVALGSYEIFMIKDLPPQISDLEFDTWVERRARHALVNTIYKLGLEHEIGHPANLLCVRGFVLPGSKQARFYRPQDLISKPGLDGRWRYNINIYTYFYLADHQIMIFIYDINAVNWADYREATKEYFYNDVIGAVTEDDQDIAFVNGSLYRYRNQRFNLRLCDGYGVGATVRSSPIDNLVNLPVFDIPNTNIDQTIAQLRMLLRSKKHPDSYQLP